MKKPNQCFPAVFKELLITILKKKLSALAKNPVVITQIRCRILRQPEEKLGRQVMYQSLKTELNPKPGTLPVLTLQLGLTHDSSQLIDRLREHNKIPTPN